MPDESPYLNALLSLCTVIDHSHNLREVIDSLLDQVVSQLHIDAVALFLYNPQGERLECTAGRGFQVQDIERYSFRLGAEPVRRAVVEGQMIHIPNLKEEAMISERTQILESEEFISYYAVPLIAREHILGVLEVFHRAPLILDSASMDFLKVLAAEAALAINNAHLLDTLQQANQELILAYQKTIEGWVRALDLRDRETAGHTLRVTQLTLKLAQKMGLSDEQLAHIGRGALLHDIGKLAIPDAILYKPGKLTAEELKLIKQHPALGYQLLSPISFLQPALDIVYCHHERWDGSGYPRGMKGEEIPLSARIFSVADVWDALVADHPYRRGTPKEEAIAYFKDQAGKTLDPQVVEAFLSVIDD